MRKRSTRSSNNSGKSEFSLSSMVDVVFLLLIFFIVVHKPPEVETLLEAGAPGGGDGPPKPLFIIDVCRTFKEDPLKDLKYYTIRGQLWTIENIQKFLTNNKNVKENTTIILNCGPNARHEKLIQLLDVCHKAELKNLNIVNNERIKFEPL